MEPGTDTLWRRWREHRDEQAFARLVRVEVPHALAAAVRTGLRPDDAEDVVQECLAELSRQESDKPVRVGLRPWLLRAASLRARMTLRSASRRRRREDRAAPPVRSSSPSLDLREEVERLLATVSEDDREAVLLRYLHDLDYADVARILATSEGTARMRVHRAITRLRNRFGREAGALVAALPLPVVRSETALLSSALASSGASTSAAVLGGALAVKTGTMTAIAALLLLLFGLLLGTRLAPADPGAASESGVTGSVTETEDGHVTLREEVIRLRAEVAGLEAELDRPPTEVAGYSADRPPIRRTGSSTDPSRAELRVRVVDGREEPVPGRSIHVSPTEGPGGQGVTTGPDGVALVLNLGTGNHRVSLGVPGGQRMLFVRTQVGWTTEAILRVPSTTTVLEGVVRLWEAELPPHVGIILHGRHGLFHDTLRVMAEPGGRYRFEGVPPGTWTLRVFGGPFKYPWNPEEDVSVPPEGTVQKDLLVGVPTLHGTVRAGTGGAPLSGVSVSVSPRGLITSMVNNQHARTDEAGGYVIRDLGPGTYRLGFRKDGLVPHGLDDLEVQRGVPRRIDVALERAAALVVQILDPAGRPFEGVARVQLHKRNSNRSVGMMDRTSADGRIRHDRLPAGDYTITGVVDGVGEGSTRARLLAGEENRVVIRLVGK